MGRKKRGSAARTVFRLVLLIGVGVAGFAGWRWLQDHPEHNPYAPLKLDDPVGWATSQKLVALRDDITECRAVLERSSVSYTALPETGEGACARPDRTQLADFPLAPATPAVTCPVATGLEMWKRKSVEPAAREILGSDLARIEHMGAFNCRKISGSSSWSQHATANAIDISAFVLEDGRRITLIGDWDEGADKTRFLQRIRDDACGIFATVLSPDFNAAHADHFHFDQDARWVSVCR
ncbi:MAG: extensin family protein [Pseudomonadota bacterium]|nr:extensin family protein [Pseudomonadota bacterium]